MFKRAAIDAFKWSTKWYLGSFSTAIATFFFFEKYMEFDRFRSIRYGVATFALTFLIKLIYTYIKLVDQLEIRLSEKDQKIDLLSSEKEKRKRLNTKSFYGEAIIILKDIFASIHLLRKEKEIEKEDVIKTLILLCDNIKSLFERRFNHNYSVCIKVLGPDIDFTNITAYAEVTTFCRDEKSYKRRSQPSGVKHNIFENTCFLEIFHNINNPQKSHYLNNDLIEDKYYKNTSFEVYGEIPEKATTLEERRKNWHLPYKSELVVPIAPLESKEEDRKTQFIGYLCVDSDTTESFHSKYDVAMLKGIADGIYDIIKTNYGN